jgi:hypothetical protein
VLTARYPCGTGESRYRCFLPDLTEFTGPPCTGPNYQHSTSTCAVIPLKPMLVKNSTPITVRFQDFCLPTADLIASVRPLPYMNHGGEGGIRTLGTLLGYTRFPVVRLQPLGHLSLIATLRIYASYRWFTATVSKSMEHFWSFLMICCFQKLTQAFAVANTDCEKRGSKRWR